MVCPECNAKIDLADYVLGLNGSECYPIYKCPRCLSVWNQHGGGALKRGDPANIYPERFDPPPPRWWALITKSSETGMLVSARVLRDSEARSLSLAANEDVVPLMPSDSVRVGLAISGEDYVEMYES